jgi:hypothetical protein
MVTGTVNSTSSGSPASAVDRSRTAIRSVSTAVMPIPPPQEQQAGRFGTGGAYRWASLNPVPARSPQAADRARRRDHQAQRMAGLEHQVQVEQQAGHARGQANGTGRVRSLVSAPTGRPR